METAVVVAEKTEQKPPLALDTLKKGFEDINNGRSLSETITFLKSLGKDVKLQPSQPPSELVIRFSSPTTDNWRGAWDNVAFITGDENSLRVADVGRRGGPAKKMVFSNFFAMLSFDRNTKKLREVLLNTTLPPRELRKAIGKVPQNWEFNPR